MRKIICQSLILLGVVLLLNACSTEHHLQVREGVKLDTLQVSLDFASNIDASIMNQYKLSLDRAVYRYNKRTLARYVAVTTDELDLTHPSFSMRIDSIRLASRGIQTQAFILSVIGIGGPILLVASGVPFPLVFWFNSYNYVYVSEGLSDDIRKQGFPLKTETIYYSPSGWFRGSKRKLKSSVRYFKNQVKKDLLIIHKSLPRKVISTS